VKLKTNATQFSNPQPPPKELYIDVPNILTKNSNNSLSSSISSCPTIISSTFSVHRSVSPSPFSLSDSTLVRSTSLVTHKSQSPGASSSIGNSSNYVPPPPPFAGTFDVPPAIIPPPTELLAQCSNTLLLEWMYMLQWLAEKNERYWGWIFGV
jgi:hypothetical protein